MGADKGTPVLATSQYTVCTYTQSLLVWVGADKKEALYFLLLFQLSSLKASDQLNILICLEYSLNFVCILPVFLRKII